MDEYTLIIESLATGLKTAFKMMSMHIYIYSILYVCFYVFTINI